MFGLFVFTGFTMKLKHRKSSEGDIYTFWCVGCAETHSFVVPPKDSPVKGWEFNGDFDKPTFSPSLLYRKCHLFLRDGIVEFLSDCRHRYAGRKIPIEDF